MEPYQCNFDEFTFSKNNDLVMHLNKHNGDNLYQCSECDFAFTQTSYLESQMKTHTR